ncbi:unnamed protein product [Prorocentrum cordatum]|uniref:Uncharacterized protein n=1 Tax=Prorocentrum cordatum TaxID=2364126 RepID=A0ABN9WIP7_9DINO|nr:unnamed protein product [Polarella glacialis]
MVLSSLARRSTRWNRAAASPLLREALASLNLEATSMDAETAVVLAEALMAPHAPPISELDLSCNELADAGASAAVALACLARRGVLQVLRLNSTALGDAGARELASALDPEAPGSAYAGIEGCVRGPGWTWLSVVGRSGA